MAKHLVIPDAHAKPGVPNDRFYKIGRLILKEKPDVIVVMGDFADMHSLSSYDKGKGAMEGRRYREDIASANQARQALESAMNRYNERQAQNKKKQYKPRKVFLMGNHEDRINKALNADPWTLEGIISPDDLGFKQAGWEVYPYLDKVVIDGVTYTHCIQRNNSGMMLGGKYHAAALLMQEHCSVTVGHSHLFDYKRDTRSDGTPIHGLVCGCAFEHHESYASQSNARWWRGVFIKDHVENGDYELRPIQLKHL